MSKQGKYQRVSAKKKLAWWKVVLIVLAVILVLGAVAVAVGWNYYKSMLGNIQQATYEEKELTDEELMEILGYVPELETTAPAVESVPETTEATEATEPTVEETTEPKEKNYGEMGKLINIMLVGQQGRYSSPSKLADTMMLLTVNRETNTLTMTSFLRDTYVQLPNYRGHVCGMQRMNVCYNLGYQWGGALGGMEMLDMLVMNNFGVEVDYNVELNFDVVTEIVDLLGGIRMNVTEDEAKCINEFKWYTGPQVEAGDVVLGGEAALMYARIRKANAADNDMNRAARQRKLITQMIKQCTEMSMNELINLLETVLPMVLTDMSQEEMVELSKIAIGMLAGLKIESNQCPADGTYGGEIIELYGQPASVLVPNLYKNKTIMMAIAEEGKTVEEAMALIEN